MTKIAGIAIALVLSATATSAHAKPLSGSEIEKTISNKTVVLATQWGAFPLRYSANGVVTGDGSGVGLAKFYAPKETGTWWVKGDRMCQKFPTWYKGQVYCFSLEQDGSGQPRWVRNDGYAGTAKIK